MQNIKHKIITLITGIALLLSPAQVFAQDNNSFEYNQTPHVQIMEDINISNDQKGDQIYIAPNITINANIDGDVFAVGEKIVINGNVDGDLRLIGAEIELNGIVTGNVAVLTEKLTTSGSADIEGDLYGYIGTLEHNGRVGANANLSFNPEARLNINGKIIGNLYYSTDNLNVSDSAFVTGEQKRVDSPITQNPRDQKKDRVIANITYSLSLILVYLIGRLFIKDRMTNFALGLKNDLAKNMLWGVLVSFVLPFVLAILFITVIGIPIASIILGLVLALLFISPIFAGILISKEIFKTNPNGIFYISLSIVIFNVIALAPYIGFLVRLGLYVLVLGYTLKLITHQKKEQNA